MKRGFTMIELIFVIVILGILAAVAIPRLAATRDDAEVSTTCSNAATLISDLGAYYTAQGQFRNAEDMTNVALTDGDNSVNMDADNAQIGLTTKNAECITFTVADADEGNVTVASSNAAGICAQVNETCGDIAKTYRFGGSNIAR